MWLEISISTGIGIGISIGITIGITIGILMGIKMDRKNADHKNVHYKNQAKRFMAAYQALKNKPIPSPITSIVAGLTTLKKHYKKQLAQKIKNKNIKKTDYPSVFEAAIHFLKLAIAYLKKIPHLPSPITQPSPLLNAITSLKSAQQHIQQAKAHPTITLAPPNINHYITQLWTYQKNVERLARHQKESQARQPTGPTANLSCKSPL